MTFRKVIALAAMLVLLVAATADAQVRTLALTGNEPGLQIRNLANGDLAVTIDVGKLEHFEVETKAGTFTQLLIPGFHASHLVGAPQLPMMNRLIALPHAAQAQVSIERVETRTIALADLGLAHPLMPVQFSLFKNQDPEQAPFSHDQASYSGIARANEELVRVVPMGRLRALDIGRLEVAPISYDAANGTIEVTERIECRVSFSGGDPMAGAALKARTHSSFFEPVYARLDGRGLHEQYPDHVKDQVTYVIITPAMFTAQLEEFSQWKTERGFNVITGVIGSAEVGATTTSIQNYIQGLYDNATPEQPAPSFVLFVGDVAQCPTYQVSGDCTDRPYCTMDGDYVPDIYYGRFSATNASQLQAILDKTLMYDRFTMPDPSYLEQVVLIAGMDSNFGSVWANGQIRYGSDHYFNAAHSIDPDLHYYPQSGSEDAMIVAEVSEGRAFVNYTAHGNTTSWADPTFTQSNVNNLQNYGEYCLAIGNCCQTGTFDYGECFGETWLRAAGKGAIGYIGGSNNTQWNEDYWWAVGYTSNIVANPTYDQTAQGVYDGLFHDHAEDENQWYVCQDAIIYCGNLAVMESGSGSTNYYWNIYNLLGDPSIVPYLGLPATNEVTHPEALVSNMTSIMVEAEGCSYVGLSQNGQLIGCGTVHAEVGSVEIDFTQQLMAGQPVKMVVMAQNREPYVVEMPVASPSIVTIEPQSVPAGVPTEVTVTVLENDGVTPIPDIEVQLTDPMTYGVMGITNADGVTVLTVDYPYGTELLMRGTHPTEGYLFDSTLDVMATPLVDPDLEVLTEPGIDGVFVLNLPSTLSALSATPEVGVRAYVPGVGYLESASGVLEFTPTTAGEVTAWIIKDGYDLYSEVFPIVTQPSVHGAVTLNGETDHSGVTVTAEPGGHVTTTAIDGTWHLLSLDAGIYQITAAKEGWSTGYAEVDVEEGEHITGLDFTLSVVYAADLCLQADLAIPDPPSAGVSSQQNCSESGAIDWIRVYVDITHGWISHLQVELTSPEGTTVLLHDQSGGSGDDIIGWYPDDLSPAEDLSTFFGEDLHGDWTLTVRDLAYGMTGVLNEWCLEIGYAGTTVAVGDRDLPEQLALDANYPNPFNPMTTISFALPKATHVQLRVYDLSGRLVVTLADEAMEAGRHQTVWTGRDDAGRQTASGMYVYRLIADGQALSRKMLLLK